MSLILLPLNVTKDAVLVDINNQPLTIDDSTPIEVNVQEPVAVSYTSSDFYTEVVKGNIPGHSIIHKFGRNDAVASGVWERVALLSVPAFHLSAATTVRIKAGGNANDTAAGTGAREVTVEGLDASGNSLSETIATNGIAASASTTGSFLRDFRAYVSAVGTYSTTPTTGTNQAAITIENTAGTQDLISIAQYEGQSQYCGYTIPAGKTGYLLSALITVDSNKTADAKIITRAGITDAAAPFSSLRIRNYWDGVTGVLPFHPKSPIGPF